MNERPVGISILAVLHAIGGVGLLVLQVVFFLVPPVSESASSVGISPAVLAIGFMLLAGLGLSSGIGMWLGTRWGWWCGALYYVYSVARNFNAFLLVADLAEGPRSREYYSAKFGGRVIVNFLIFLYFFKSNVLAYFGMTGFGKLKAVGILIAITATIFGLFYILGRLVGVSA